MKGGVEVEGGRGDGDTEASVESGGNVDSGEGQGEAGGSGLDREAEQ